MSYKLSQHGSTVRRLADNADVPLNAPGNRDYEEYQRWLAQGNTPLPADPPPAPTDLADAIMALPPAKRAALKAWLLS